VPIPLVPRAEVGGAGEEEMSLFASMFLACRGEESFDAMLEAEDKDDLEKLAAAEPKMLLPVVVLPQPLLGRTPWPRSTSCCC
jgi:hypothetical protein